MLHERAMLVKLNISQWTGRKKDKRITKETNAFYGAAKSSGSYSKVLVSKDAVKSIQMCVKDVAKFLKKSQSWVYKNFEILGGVKVGGSVLFPSKEKIYERLFQQEKEVVRVLLPVQKTAVHGGRVQEEKGSKETAKPEDRRNRHGLFDFA
jgi:hypothetical protein